MDDFKALDELIDELRLSLHRITQVAEDLHRDESISIGMRGVLEYLFRNSDATVPTIARRRHVSRQLIQTLVNSLLEQNFVELVDNPAHRRSPLVTLTPTGERMLGRMRRREHAYFESIGSNVSEARITSATRTLRALRVEFGGGDQ
jgi:DNA-binding MarR family transcriptional regulator